MALWGWPDTKSRPGWARRRFRMSLARFRLRHGQRSADADPRSLAVDGSDPPSRHASIGIGEDGAGQPHPPRRCGVAPSQRSFAGRPWSAASRRRTTARGNAKGRAARSSRRPLLSARFPVPCPGTVPRASDDAPRLDGRAGVERMNRRRRSGSQPPSRRDISRGATPAGGGGGRVKARTPPRPNQAPVALGSLPSTSVLPSAAQAAGWQRPQLQAPARDSRIRRVRIFTGAMRASTPNVSCTLQYGTSRGLLIGSVPPRAEPSARCRCVASAPALPACAPASSARRCASSWPASLRTPSGPGHPP